MIDAFVAALIALIFAGVCFYALTLFSFLF